MHCTTRERIGFLLPEKRDTWWEVNPKTKATDLAAQLTPAVGAAMRWFEDMKSTRDAATYLEKTGYFYLAAAAYLGVADLASAKLCVRRAIDLGRITADGVAWARSRKLIE
jgi:hypothetical protein